MALVRSTVEMGRTARAQAKAKNRQPLAAAVVVADAEERDALERHAGLVRDELNVKALRFVSGSDELGSYAVKANYRTLGPRFGKHMPLAAAAIGALDATKVAAALRAGHSVGINVDGHEHELGPDDLQLAMQPLDGYQVERAGSHAVALELGLTEALLREGIARELVHAIQGERRDAGLDVSDRIALTLDGDAETLAAARDHEDYIAGEVLATSVTIGQGNGSDLRIRVTRA